MSVAEFSETPATRNRLRGAILLRISHYLCISLFDLSLPPPLPFQVAIMRVRQRPIGEVAWALRLQGLEIDNVSRETRRCDGLQILGFHKSQPTIRMFHVKHTQVMSTGDLVQNTAWTMFHVKHLRAGVVVLPYEPSAPERSTLKGVVIAAHFHLMVLTLSRRTDCCTTLGERSPELG